MVVRIEAFIVLAIQCITGRDGISGLISYKPIYYPDTFNFGAVMTATSFAALIFIEFDGVTTLDENVKKPQRNILLTPVLVCLFTGLISMLQIYIA